MFRKDGLLASVCALLGFGLLAGVIALVLTFKIWLFGSLAVSAVKAMSNSCGKTYPVEVYVINGNWFCSKESEDVNSN